MAVYIPRGVKYMLSKNNYKERLRKMEPRKNRYSIRKFSVGAASVLIGFFLMGFGQNQTVKADTTSDGTNPDNNQQTPHEATTSKDVTNGTEGHEVVVQETSKEKLKNVEQENKAAAAQAEVKTSTADKNKAEVQTQAAKTLEVKTDASKNEAAKPEAKTAQALAAAKPEAKSESKSLTVADVQKQYSDLEAKLKSGALTEEQATAEAEKLRENFGKLSKADQLTLNNLVLAAEPAAAKTLRGTQSQEVSDWQGLVNALNDSSVGTIKLTSDITVADKGTNVNGIKRPQPVVNGGKMNLTGSNISGGLDIDGQGHAINFGANYLSFDTDNQKDSNPWDIDFKNLTINADGYANNWSTLGGAFSPIYMGGDDLDTKLLAKNKVTFENVTADVKNGAFYNTTMAQQTTDNPYTTVTFKGNNNITVEAVNVKGNQLYNYSSAVSASHIIFADGTNTVFNVSTAKTNNDQNAGGNILRAKIEDSTDTAPAIDVQQGATVTLNGNSTDVKGMLVDSAITGTVNVDGNLNANMADGHSMAIWAGNLTIGKTGVVNINTRQSNDGTGANGVTNYNGYHFAPISLGVGFAANVTNADANVLDNAGTLIIKRTGDNNKSTSPLISFGSGSGYGSKWDLNVHEGAILDLQDGAQSSIAGSFTNTPNIGIITMWGGGTGKANSYNNLTITNPKYVNLQRTGGQTGTLLRLENMNNHVNISSTGGNLPFAQWDEANKSTSPSYYWYIDNLQTQNNWGNNAITGFTQDGNTVGQNKKGEIKFLHSDGQVNLAQNQAGLNSYQYNNGVTTQGQPVKGVKYETPYLNRLLNNFNWWTPQRISMGTALAEVAKPTDSDQYQPVVKTIDGNTKQTLNDLTAKDGISGLRTSDGTVTNDLSPIKSVTWYDAATDATQWSELMSGQEAPTNPTGNLKTTDTSAWAKVTYTDGSVDFANIPLNITAPMADTYTPSYNPVNVEQGKTATDDPTFTGTDGKSATVPDGTKFTTDEGTPDWATIDPSTGTVTVAPGTDVTPGAYNVPVTVTYPDKSNDNTTVPVVVTKTGQTVIWGDNGAVVVSVDSSKLNAHETTDNSQVLNPANAVTSVQGYKLVDGKLVTTPTDITVDPSNVSWTTTPNTNVDTATAKGKLIQNNTIKVDLTNNTAAQDLLGSKNGTVTTKPFDIIANGAGAKNVATPVKVDLGSDLTSEQFSQLVDNNIPTDEIASTTWATKPDAKGQGGVIKITFTDKDANGNPTYLNVDVPASSLDIVTDADTHTPQGQDVSTKVGETPEAPEGIKNKTDLPDGTKYTWETTPDTTTPGKKPAVVVVTYPDGSKDNVPVNVIVDAKPEVKPITTTVGGDPAASEGIANLNNGGTTPVDGYPSGATWVTKPDTTKPGATTGTATVTYPDGTKETVTIPVAVNGQGDITVIDDKGHVFSLHANDVVTHKTSDKNIIGAPVIESFKLSYYQGGQNYSKPYIYTLNDDKTAYVLTQTGDNPAGVTVNAQQSINVSDIKISWTADGTPLFNNALGEIKGNGQPSSLATEANGGTKTIEYTNWLNNQFGYPKYSAVVDTSNVDWPIYGNGPVSTYPFPSVYIYGAEANGTIPSVNSDTTDLKAALGDAAKLLNTSDLTAAHNSTISTVEWQTLPSLETANAKAPAEVRIHFTDGSYLDVPVAVNVIKVDQGVDNKDNHDIYRDITRTINVEGQASPVVQHVIYSRAKITNLAKPEGQQVTYTDWVAAKNSDGQEVTNFPRFEVTKPGYTATATGATIETTDGKQYVPASDKITPESQNEVVNVSYTANEHTLVITYVDSQTGQQVGNAYDVPGKTGEQVNVDVEGHVPTNWKLVPGQEIVSSYTFGSNDPQPVTYKVEHGTQNVPVDKNNHDTYREVTQTIYEIPAGKTEADKITVRTVTVPFQRTGVKDLVTNKTAWNAWEGPKGSKVVNNVTTYEIGSYSVPQVKGYDSYVNGTKSTEVAPVTVNPDSTNITDTITYVKQGSTPLPYDPARDDMSVTRTINYDVPAGHEAIASVPQTIEYTRDVNGVAGYTDPLTGKPTWNPWHVKSGKAEFPSAAVQQISGYDSYVDGVKATEVPPAQVVEKDGTPQNGATVTVTYKKSGSETPTEENFKQSIVYQDKNGNTIGTAKDVITGTFTSQTSATVTANELKTKIDANVPTNWKIATSYTYPAAETIKTKTPANIVVLVEHETKNITPTDPGVDPKDPKYKDMFTTVSRDIYQTKPGEAETKIDTQYVDFGRNGIEDLVTGEVTGTGDWQVGKIENNKFVEGGKAEFASENAPQIKGYDSYVNGAKATEVPAVSALKDGQPANGAAVHITYVKQGSTPVPYKPGKDGVNDDMNKYVTRTIVVHEPGQHPENHYQTVHFTNEDNDGNSGYIDPVTGETTYNTVWHVAGDLNATTGSWAEFTAPTVKGYTASPAKVDAKNDITAETKNVTVDITYAPVAPEGQDVNTKTGVVPDPAEGIKNKGNLPDGTKYTWKDTPDVTTPGDKPAVVIVTYPDGSKDEVPVTVHVTNPVTPTPGNPTDADTYNPQGKDVHTTVGHVPDPSQGIANKGDLPSGTTYTWEKTPDVSKPGTVPAVIVVHYPDGSSETVPVNVVVTNPIPEGQDIHTKPGQTPDPSEGIKNKDDMPDGTKYTWKDQPDVTTPGSHPAVIIVTFPNGETVEVPVTVIVDGNDDSGDNNTGDHNGNTGNNNTGNGGQSEVSGNRQETNFAKSETGKKNVSANDKKTLPQTGADQNAAGILGLAIAAVGSLLGLGAGKKRRDK